MITASESAKLSQLYEKYGITSESVDSADSVDLARGSDASAHKETPLM